MGQNAERERRRGGGVSREEKRGKERLGRGRRKSEEEDFWVGFGFGRNAKRIPAVA